MVPLHCSSVTSSVSPSKYICLKSVFIRSSRMEQMVSSWFGYIPQCYSELRNTPTLVVC